jgi:Flp pilus assembly pilin Flp
MNIQDYKFNQFDHGPEVLVHKGGLEVDGRNVNANILPVAYKSEHPTTEIATSKTGNRVPFGLSALAFGLLVALTTMVVVGGAIGGGLGGALASAHGKNSNAMTVTRTITIASTIASSPTASGATVACTTATSGPFSNLTVPAAADVASLFLDCPNLNNAKSTPSNNEQFTFTCGVSYPGGGAAYSGGTIATLAGLIAYSPQDCAVACSTFNAYSAQFGNATVCAAMTFASDLSVASTTYGANCWLFNTTGPPDDNAVAISGVLLQ